MNEILLIFFQVILFFIFTSLPVNKFLIIKNNNFTNINFIEAISLNSLLLMFLLLVCSFLKISIENIFLFIFCLYFIFFIFCIKNIFEKKFSISLLNIIFIFFLICIFFNTAYKVELGWDGFLWKEKVNFFFNGGYFFEINNYSVEKNVFNHYPHLGSYIWAFFWKNSWMKYEYLGRLFYDYIYIVSLFGIAFSFKKLQEFKKVLLIVFLFMCTYDDKLGGYQDYLIFSLITIFATFLINNYYNKINDKLFHICFVFTGVLLPWIKNEGLIYSIFIILIFFFYENKIKTKTKKNLNSYFLVIMVILSMVLKSYIFLVILKEDTILQFEIDYEFIFNMDFISFVNKVYYICYYSINSFFKYPIWLINLIGLIICIYNFKKIKLLRIFFVFLILNFIFIFGVFLTFPYDIEWYLAASLDRLLLQTSGFYILMFSVLFKNKIVKL